MVRARDGKNEKMEKILVVEDDRATRKALQQLFEHEGYGVEIAQTGPQGLEMFRGSRPSFVILDLGLPQLAGQEVCRAIRKESEDVPILILTGSSDEISRVLLLELGADDYVTKPFSPKELLARVRAAVRRSSRPVAAETFTFDNVVIDFTKMIVVRDGSEVALTPQEFKIVKFMTQNPNRVVSREELLNDVWGYQNYPTTRTVDNHILKLRQKLEADPANPVHFRTVHGVGYKFVP